MGLWFWSYISLRMTCLHNILKYWIRAAHSIIDYIPQLCWICTAWTNYFVVSVCNKTPGKEKCYRPQYSVWIHSMLYLYTVGDNQNTYNLHSFITWERKQFYNLGHFGPTHQDLLNFPHGQCRWGIPVSASL